MSDLLALVRYVCGLCATVHCARRQYESEERREDEEEGERMVGGGFEEVTEVLCWCICVTVCSLMYLCICVDVFVYVCICVIALRVPTQVPHTPPGLGSVGWDRSLLILSTPGAVRILARFKASC